MSHTDGYSRRKILTLAAGASAVFTFDPAFAASTPSTETGGKNMLTRAIPSSNEPLPMVGLGTYRGFDVAPSDAAYKQCNRRYPNNQVRENVEDLVNCGEQVLLC